ncbi:MAG: nicotinate-nucleotide--dimethylbenzimidazole phosphoribosyltransferase [Bacillariaceae sp.]|jgi:nicotinate-nucleotide--dimethylbenzimidazole phosphoribosyltransferase
MSTPPPVAKKNVLDPGTVESRGFGGDKNQSRDELADEIEEFIHENTMSVQTEIRCFMSILLFVTTITCPPDWAKIHPGFLMKGMCYFPVVGAIVGYFVALVFDMGFVLWELPVVVAAALSTTISFQITGCLHEDGLADSADGLGGGWTRPQILRIMSDSRLGTFGSAALVMYIFTKLELLAALDKSSWKLYDFNTCGDGGEEEFCGSHGAGPALIVAHALARLTAPYLIWRCPYIEEDGEKSNFYSFMIRAKFLSSGSRLLFSILFCYGISAIFYGPYLSLSLVVVVFICAEVSGSYARKKLGGVMGDYLGATICITELMIYSSLAGGSVFESLKERLEILLDTRTSSQEGWKVLMQDEKLRLLTRFIFTVILYQLWCWLVQSVDKKSSEKESESKNDVSDTTTSPQKKPAQDVLTSSTSSFMDKYNSVQNYIDCLAKPVGSLGTLEEWAARICALQNSMQPKANLVNAIIFAGDHGVAMPNNDGGEGCSAYPQSVTRAIIQGLQQKVAGASVLAQEIGIDLSVVDVGVVGEIYEGPVVESASDKLSNGTRNFCNEPAMTIEEVDRCLKIGKDTITKAVLKGSCKVVALGEIGIGNTTTASALIAALTGEPVENLCGGGAFASRMVDNDVIKKKIGIVEKAMKKHKGTLNESFSILSKVGGAEIAALVGAMIEASDRNIAVLVDGFIVTTAALIAVRMKPSVCNVLFFTTKSAEKGQQVAIQQIQAIAREHNLPIPSSPALSMGLRMGECTGALLAVPILQSSTAMIANMATIQDILS